MIFTVPAFVYTGLNHKTIVVDWYWYLVYLIIFLQVYTFKLAKNLGGEFH